MERYKQDQERAEEEEKKRLGYRKTTHCGLCKEEFSINESIVNSGNGSNCHHTFCKPCLKNYIMEKLTKNEEVPCPPCEHLIHEDIINRLIPTNL